MKNPIKVFHFSAGESSGMMTILGKPGPNDIVLFADTKRELDRSYAFLDEFERNEGIKVHRAVFTHKNAPGQAGYDAYLNAYKKQYLPNVNTRGCTRELKIRTAKRYLKALGIRRFVQYIGFRSDEPDRIKDHHSGFKKVSTVFLLNDLGIDKAAVNAFWSLKSYRLGIPSILKNCDLCFLKGKDNIIKIMQARPKLAAKWIKDESKGNTFINGVTYQELFNIAMYRNSIGKTIDLESLEPAYSCACTSY